jgi:phosphotransferase system enzyme I (PtsI)
MEESTPRAEKVLRGLSAAPGVAVGPAYLLLRGVAKVPKYTITDPEAEMLRLRSALDATRLQIEALRDQVAGSMGDAEAAIFDAHLLVLEDDLLVGEVEKRVRRRKLNVEHLFSGVADRYIKAFAKIDDDFLRERATDIRDVTGRVLDNLLGLARQGRVGEASVIAAADLTPSDTASLPADEVLAVVTEGGSRTSHSAIMARALEVPAVVGVHGLLKALAAGDTLVVDGDAGEVIIHPSATTLERARAAAAAHAVRRVGTAGSPTKLPSPFRKEGTEMSAIEGGE